MPTMSLSTGTFMQNLPTGTIDSLNAIFPVTIGLPNSPQTIQSPFLQVAQFLGIDNGWFPSTGTWTFVSADSPSFVVTVGGNITGSIGAGTKLKLTHLNSQKNFIVTQVNGVTGSTTYLNLYGGTDYTLTTGTISSPFYSNGNSPAGFNNNPNKWTVEVTNNQNQNKDNPTQLTWYNITGSLSINVPIGCWNLEYAVELYGYRTTLGQAQVMCTLSTANNSESDNDFHAEAFSFCQVNGVQADVGSTVSRRKIVLLTSKTTYYLNQATNQANMLSLYAVGANCKTILRAICAYL